jgi:hypothetical protein
MEISCIDLFSASVVADRINGGYYKRHGSFKPTTENAKFNRDLMVEILADKSWEPRDIEQAQEIIDYYRGKLLVIMSGKANDYTVNAAKVANLDTIDDRDYLSLGVAASLPEAYRSSVAFDLMLERAESTKRESQHWGSVGDPFSGTVEVTHSFYSKKWFRHYVTVKSINSAHVFNFSSDRVYKFGDIITIRGRVRDHISDNVTRLNYVKVVENNS